MNAGVLLAKTGSRNGEQSKNIVSQVSYRPCARGRCMAKEPGYDNAGYKNAEYENAGYKNSAHGEASATSYFV